MVIKIILILKYKSLATESPFTGGGYCPLLSLMYKALDPALQQRRKAAHTTTAAAINTSTAIVTGMGLDGRLVHGGHNVGALEHLQIVVKRDYAKSDGKSYEGKGTGPAETPRTAANRLNLA